LAVYNIVTVPDPILRQKAQKVEKINAGVLRVMDNMRDTMYAADGVGLAAPQIGVSKRIIVIDPGDQLIEMINPQIIYREGEQTAREGCLSVPDLVGWCKRAQKIRVKGLNRDGEEIEMEATDMLARVFQHEIDHLDGIVFPDKAIQTKKI
jgi:peptide deformylase